MKYVSLFEGFVLEKQSSEFLETPKILQKINLGDFLKKKSKKPISRVDSGPAAPDRVELMGSGPVPSPDIIKFPDCRKFAVNNKNKEFTVPQYGEVKDAKFILGEFANASSEALNNEGCGVWVNAKRKQNSTVDGNYSPEVFIVPFVTPKEEIVASEFNSPDFGPKIQIEKNADGYYSFLLIFKRDGENVDEKTPPVRFTYDQLISADPNWKSYFSDLVKIAKK